MLSSWWKLTGVTFLEDNLASHAIRCRYKDRFLDPRIAAMGLPWGNNQLSAQRYIYIYI